MDIDKLDMKALDPDLCEIAQEALRAYRFGATIPTRLQVMAILVQLKHTQVLRDAAKAK